MTAHVAARISSTLLAAVVIGLLSLPSEAHADQCISVTSGARILPPSAGDVVMSAFQRAEPDVVLQNAQIICDHVRAHVCAGSVAEGGDAPCAQLRLSDPRLPCKGTKTGPWCFQVVEGDLGSQRIERLVKALGEDDPESAWSGQRRGGGEAGWATPPQESLAVPIVEGTAAALLLFALFGIIRRFPGDEKSRREILRWVILVAVALALRAWLAPHSPGDLRFRLEHAFDLIGRGQAYTWGWSGLLHLLFRAIPASDAAVFWINGLLAALTAIPVGWVVRRLSGDARAGWLAGIAMALTPLHIRFSMTDTPFIGEIFFGTSALALILHWIRHPRWIHAAMAGLALALAVQMRPLGVLWLLPALFLLLALAREVPWRSRTLWGASMLVIGLLSTHVAELLDAFHTIESYITPNPEQTGSWLLWPVWFDPAYTPISLLVATVAALLPGPMAARHRAWILGCGILFSGVVNAMSPDGHHLANARYALRGLPFAAMLAGVGLSHVAERLPMRANWAAAILLLGGLLPAMEIAERRTTLDHEYAFFVDALESVPDHCTIVSLIDSEDRSLIPRTHLGITRGLSHTWMHFESPGITEETPSCFAYYRPASCWVNRPHCQAFEDQWTLEPLAEAQLPAIPFAGEPFIRDPIPVGFYRLRHRSP